MAGRTFGNVSLVIDATHAPSQSSLRQLAEYAGIMIEYEDVFGEKKACSDESLRALLTAMGFDATEESAAAASLLEAQRAVWLRTLEPVYVLPEERPPELSIRVRAGATDTFEWSVAAQDAQDDATLRGTVAASALPLRESVIIADIAYERRSLTLPRTLVAGYYRIHVSSGGAESNALLAIVPQACYLPPDLEKRGVWGLSAQLYALRSQRPTGIGDYSDLALLCRTVASAGGAAVGINPLHELTFSRDRAPSPYCPSSRIFLNWIYLDVEALPGFEGDPSSVSLSDRIGTEALIDYDCVAASKRAAAERAYWRFHERDIVPAVSEAARAFAAFVSAGGDALRATTVFDALAEYFSVGGSVPAWQAWPAAYHDPASPAVHAFEMDHVREIEFFAYLQWQADLQLAGAADAGLSVGLSVGLYRDLAVGADLGGADTWTQQATLRSSVTVGAPPDILNRRGQAWGVAPFDPLALRAAEYEPFVGLLRANMRHAGALRIDHVMALARLYWVPENAEPSAGAYVTYRLDELLGIIALESVRARCMIIGEDLGTVPDGFRERLQRARILSYRLLEFEQDDERFFAPNEYPELALVSTGTHDLPSIGAYWTAHDIDVRAELGLLGDEAAVLREREERAAKRVALLAALRAVGLPQQQGRRFDDAAARPGDRETLAEIALWANRFLARSPSRLLMVQLEDLLGEVEQVNVPATTDEHPNWRRRSSIGVEELATDARFVELVSALSLERGARQ